MYCTYTDYYRCAAPLCRSRSLRCCRLSGSEKDVLDRRYCEQVLQHVSERGATVMVRRLPRIVRHTIHIVLGADGGHIVLGADGGHSQ